MFDNHVLNNSAFESDLNIDKDQLLGKMIDIAPLRIGTSASSQMLFRYQQEMKEKNRLIINDDDLIYVSGDTYEWKDQLKEYAYQYGDKIKGNRKALWIGRTKSWQVHYKAYKKFIVAYPGAEKDLNIEKVL